jgi:hyperosmotically inducible periplasmic protein
MRTNRTPVALVSMLAAAALLAACEKKTTTVNDTTPGSTSSTTTTVTTSPLASDAMAATTNAMDKAASATERGMAKAGEKLDDAAITGKVKSALIADPDIQALKIDVDTKDNVVTLNGSAKSKANGDKAVTIAQGVDSVKSVDNRLTIKP